MYLSICKKSYTVPQKYLFQSVYRDDYLGSLRRLSCQKDPGAFIRMLARLHEFSATIISDDINEMQVLLENSNAFLEHTEGKLKIMRS